MIVLVILGYILAALFILLTLILVMPIEFIVDGQKYEKAFIKAGFLWFMGAVGFQFIKVQSEEAIMCIRILGFKKTINISKIDKNRSKVKKKPKEKPKEKNYSRNYLESDFLKCALKSSIKVLNHMKPKKFVVEGRIGFEDPYITGIVCAISNVLCKELKKANIKVYTVFDEEIFEGKCLIQGRMVLAYMAYVALRLYLSRPVRINKSSGASSPSAFASFIPK